MEPPLLPTAPSAAVWELDQPLPGGASKIRLMCSYGGHIFPRPHDKSLCYVGGETRMVAVGRHETLAELTTRLSTTLPINGRPFTLKYQLPLEDLDSLISVTTDEDLENLIDEYDRAAATSAASSPRIRLFLFFLKPETAASMGALLHDGKSDSWFVDALNGSGLLPRNLSDSAANLDCLLTGGGADSFNELAAAKSHADFFGDHENGKPNVTVALPEVHSISESAFVENNTSSSGSSTSSPCVANLPQIRVREDHANAAGGQKPAGIEEQFAQLNFAANPAAPSVAVNSGGGETMNRINSEDDIAAQNVPVAFRKPPLPMPLQPQHFKVNGGGGGGYSLPSPDSVASDCSIASANSMSKPMYYQEQVQAVAREARAPVSPNTPSAASDQGCRNQGQDSGYGIRLCSDNSTTSANSMSKPMYYQEQVQVVAREARAPVSPNTPSDGSDQGSQNQGQDSGYGITPQSDLQQQNQLQQQQQQQQQQLLHQQQQQQQQLQQQHLQQQQQFVHASANYMNIHHPVAGQVPMSPYYTMYAPPSQHQQLHHPIDHQKQYPVYIMPCSQSQQPYKMVLQSNIPDPTAAAASTHMTSQNPAAYTDSIPPVYPPKAASPATPEMTQGLYQASATPQLVQIPSGQYQHQYLSYSQVHHPSQSVAVPSSTTAPNYAYEFSNPSHEQVFYTQRSAVPMPTQYQSMTPAAAAAAVAMSDEAKQLASYPAAADQSHTAA